MSRRSFVLTPELMLQAYRTGLFPMAETRDSTKLYWLDPEMRGILPLADFHVPRRLWRTVLSGRFTVTANHDFAAVIAACAEATTMRPESWINTEIARIFIALHGLGHAHSIEVWQDGVLCGGLYGAALGGAFFGESMFSRATDASKLALVHLIARLRLSGFTLLDTQFVTEHLQQFGAMEIPRELYRGKLEEACLVEAVFDAAPAAAILQNYFAVMRAEERGHD
jgi:leucyl/phenylalanyl-tRNA--protein transferase